MEMLALFDLPPREGGRDRGKEGRDKKEKRKRLQTGSLTGGREITLLHLTAYEFTKNSD